MKSGPQLDCGPLFMFNLHLSTILTRLVNSFPTSPCTSPTPKPFLISRFAFNLKNIASQAKGPDHGLRIRSYTTTRHLTDNRRAMVRCKALDTPDTDSQRCMDVEAMPHWKLIRSGTNPIDPTSCLIPTRVLEIHWKQQLHRF